MLAYARESTSDSTLVRNRDLQVHFNRSGSRQLGGSKFGAPRDSAFRKVD